jgi:hypothetical protein
MRGMGYGGGRCGVSYSESVRGGIESRKSCSGILEALELKL